MKNAINYYYNLYPKNIYQNKKEFYFYINKFKYSLVKYNDDIKKINDIYYMHLDILKKGIYVHSVILNRDSYPVTIINQKPYVLMKIKKSKENISLNDITEFSKVLVPSKEKNWGKLWETKNDYLEFQISKLGTNHKTIRDSFGYFIGLGETSIYIYNRMIKQNINQVYAHKRIDDIYNPLNIITDSKVRDPAEYFKAKFFEERDIEPELYTYLNNNNLNYTECILFLARMIYPTPYYDLFEEIITGREEEKKILRIIEKAEEYEKLIKKLYQYYKMHLNITPIEWLE